MSSRVKRHSHALLAVIALAGLSPVSELLEQHNPWQKTLSVPNRDAIMVIARAEKFQVSDCAKILSHALELKPEGKAAADASGWEPWDENELSGVRKCEDFPCAVKLDAKEVQAMRSQSSDHRLAEFLSLVASRMRSYQSSGKKSEYEFAGAIEDPGAVFEKVGFHTDLKPGASSQWIYRTVSFGRGSKPLRQVLERVTSSSATESWIRIRDAYTDHYFDGWGEWMDVQCEGGKSQVVAALSLEVDLLKKNDLLALISRSKLKSEMEEAGQNYLNRWMGGLKPAYP